MSGPDRASAAFQAQVAVFRRGLADSASRPEFVRAAVVYSHLRTNLVCPYVSQHEVFTTTFGPGGARRFWEIECSEPIRIERFARLLAVTAATESDPEAGTVESRDARFEGWTAAVMSSVFGAFKAGEKWFIGDTSALAAVTRWQEVETTAAPSIDPRRAAEWLLKMPKRRHLVPASLVEYLQPKQAKREIKRQSQARVAEDFTSWFNGKREATGELPSADEAKAWAKTHSIPTTITRPLYSKLANRPRGRPPKKSREKIAKKNNPGNC